MVPLRLGPVHIVCHRFFLYDRSGWILNFCLRLRSPGFLVKQVQLDVSQLCRNIYIILPAVYWQAVAVA
jgi:hypothetical protein